MSERWMVRVQTRGKKAWPSTVTEAAIQEQLPGAEQVAGPNPRSWVMDVPVEAPDDQTARAGGEAAVTTALRALAGGKFGFAVRAVEARPRG